MKHSYRGDTYVATDGRYTKPHTVCGLKQPSYLRSLCCARCCLWPDIRKQGLPSTPHTFQGVECTLSNAMSSIKELSQAR